MSEPSPVLVLKQIPGRYAICRLEPNIAFPNWATEGKFVSLTRTPDELSIVCGADVVPTDVHAEDGWRILAVEGPLDFNLTGILAQLANPLEYAGVSLFAVSTFDTDYILVRDSDLERAIKALREAGHNVSEGYT